MYNKKIADVIRGIIYTLGVLVLLSAATSCSKESQLRGGNCDETVYAMISTWNPQWKRWEESDFEIMDRCPCEEEVQAAIEWNKTHPIDQQYKISCKTP